MLWLRRVLFKDRRRILERRLCDGSRAGRLLTLVLDELLLLQLEQLGGLCELLDLLLLLLRGSLGSERLETWRDEAARLLLGLLLLLQLLHLRRG